MATSQTAGRPADSLSAPMRRALELAWESARAGSLGIGAAVWGVDGPVATGRNRIFEDEPGDDHLAGSSLAHAEMNALAKLRFRAHEGDRLELHTTLQPCVQCLGAIRLSPVRRVHVLAPDPIFRGIEAMRDLTPFVARRWPVIEQRPVDEWAVLSLVFPTHADRYWDGTFVDWNRHLPTTTELARRLHADGRLDAWAAEEVPLDTLAERLWTDLGRCVSEVAELAAT